MIPTAGELFARDVARMHGAWVRGNKLVQLFFHRRIWRRYSCHISPSAQISRSASFPHPVGIVIGDGAVVGEGCTVYQHVTIGRLRREAPEYPVIEDGCVLYAGSCVLGRARLGAGSSVGANSVVLGGGYAPNSVLVGAPARRVGGEGS